MTREKAIEEINNYENYPNGLSKECRDYIIKALEQEPKTGRWIMHKQYGIEHIECSECSSWFLRENLVRNSYCPNCGCRMVKPQESDG